MRMFLSLQQKAFECDTPHCAPVFGNRWREEIIAVIDVTPALDRRADPRLLLECAHASSNPTTQIPKTVRAWISDAGGNALFLDALVP